MARVPSGLNAALAIIPRCCSGGVTGLAVAASQTRAAKSRLAVMTRVPSGLNAALTTMPGCSSGGATGSPVAALQIRAV